MCGIIGAIGNTDIIDIHKLNSTQKHRGPDNQGSWSNENIKLGNQRLSIIDLNERSNQPFKKDKLVIVFNGEIYNYKELQRNLSETHKINFKTNSDTEVVLEMYKKFGPKCLDHLIGMFSFAIYDIQTKKTFIARDHFGIKPLFYTQINKSFVFASELKTLVQIKGFDKTINMRSIVNCMNYLWIPESESMFINTNKLPPAHYMEIDKNLSIKIERYWDLKDVKHSDKNEKNLINKLDKIINESVKRHLVSDVPVSSFLSGGLDSSLISVIAKNELSSLSTYTISKDVDDQKIEQMPDDEKYAKKLAKLFEFDYNEIKINANIVDMLPDIVRILDEPIGDPAAINTFMICKMAKENGVKVILSGMGADEIFFGYRRQKANIMIKRFNKLPNILKKIIITVVHYIPVRIFGRGLKLARWSKKFLSFANMEPSNAYRASYSYYSENDLKDLILNSDSLVDEININHRAIHNKMVNYDDENKMCYTDINMFMVGLNLAYTDRASMAQSVEVRVPFIDKNLIEYAMSIPGNLKYKNNQSKYILKKVAENYLPNEIVYRSKASFGAPIRSWISNDLRKTVDDLLSESNIKKRGLFNYEVVKKMIDKDRKGAKDYAYQIYQLITLEYWFREFVD